ncbi:hypothetical protein I552_1491 [Mycobacterium xenopi 3993]|nr:hypothetical protein I552_1491 [Mycobacterium xenopi 3993]
MCRLTAEQVPGAMRRGAVLVDIRPQAQRAVEGRSRARWSSNATSSNGDVIQPATPGCPTLSTTTSSG